MKFRWNKRKGKVTRVEPDDTHPFKVPLPALPMTALPAPELESWRDFLEIEKRTIAYGDAHIAEIEKRTIASGDKVQGSLHAPVRQSLAGKTIDRSWIDELWRLEAAQMRAIAKKALTLGETMPPGGWIQGATAPVQTHIRRYGEHDYQDAIKIICETDEGMEQAGIPVEQRDTMIEVMRARYALLFAQDHDKFDSFRFSNAARRGGHWEQLEPPQSQMSDGKNTMGYTGVTGPSLRRYEHDGW